MSDTAFIAIIPVIVLAWGRNNLYLSFMIRYVLLSHGAADFIDVNIKLQNGS